MTLLLWAAAVAITAAALTIVAFASLIRKSPTRSPVLVGLSLLILAATLALPAGSAHAVAVTPLNCAAHLPMRVRFYDVGQGLAALVELPDGRRILVDTGPPVAHFLPDNLLRDLAGKPLDLLWITHQHIDHLGGADNVLQRVKVRNFIDNGRLMGTLEVKKAHGAAREGKVNIRSFGPGTKNRAPLPSNEIVKITAILPTSWLGSCKTNENQCSIGLRIDYCRSSVLFTGDAEVQEEEILNPGGSATLLQLGHHGSDTSSSEAFLARVKPKYAVVSAGKPFAGANVTYCHPRVSIIRRVTKLLGGSGSRTLTSFDGLVSCRKSKPANWTQVPASDRLWSTSRDGDVVLLTHGDGVFTRNK